MSRMIRTPLGRHCVAVAVVLLTLAAKGPIERLVGPGPPLIFFVPAVTISAWQGGAGPGLLATALAAALCAFNYFTPFGSLAVSNPNDIARMIAFVSEGILTSVLMEWLHRARRQAEESRGEANGFKEESRRAEERLRAIIDNADALIYTKNVDLSYNLMNRKLRDIAGVGQGKVAGLSDFDLFPKAVAEGIQANDRQRPREGEADGVRGGYSLGRRVPYLRVAQVSPARLLGGAICSWWSIHRHHPSEGGPGAGGPDGAARSHWPDGRRVGPRGS